MADNIVDAFNERNTSLGLAKASAPKKSSFGSVALFISEDFDSRSIRSRDFDHSLKSKDLDSGFKNIFKLVYLNRGPYLFSQLLHSKLLESLSYLINKLLLNSKLILISLSLGLILNLTYYSIAKFHYYSISAVIILGNYLMAYAGAVILSVLIKLKSSK